MTQAYDALNNLAQVNFSLYRTGPPSVLDNSIWMVHNKRSVLQKLSKQVRLFAFCSVLPLFFFSSALQFGGWGWEGILFCTATVFFLQPYNLCVCVCGGGGQLHTASLQSWIMCPSEKKLQLTILEAICTCLLAAVSIEKCAWGQ